MSTDIIQHRRPGALVLLPALVLLMLLGTGCSDKETTSSQVPATPPVEALESPVAEQTGTQAAAVDGQKIYQASCQACHMAGIAGAPKLGDKDTWAPRIAKGKDALLASVKNGLKAMPPKGTCMGCSDDELRAAMEYMVGQGS